MDSCHVLTNVFFCLVVSLPVLLVSLSLALITLIGTLGLVLGGTLLSKLSDAYMR